MSEILVKPNSDDLVDIGEAHHKAGRLVEAEAHYVHALEVDPGHPGALYYLANIAYEDGRLVLAAQLVAELLAGDPNDAEAWHLSGLIALKRENYAVAIDNIKKSINIEPNFALAHYSLGNVLNCSGESEAALASFQRAVQLNPTLVDAYRAMGNLFHAQKKFDDALACYKQALDVQPDFKLAYEGVGGILLSQERWDEAIEIYRKAISENAAGALIHVGLGVAYINKERFADAAVYFEQAISIDPDCFLAHFHLGGTLIKLSRLQDAVKAYERAVSLNPQDTLLLGELASLLLLRLRNFDKAAEIYRHWLTVEPDNPLARHHLAACTGKSVPVRAGDAYVERTFDAFADTFDETLGGLKYCGPNLLMSALKRARLEPSKQFVMLDAGCGTGACGVLVAPYAIHLTGVDISGNMLEKARARNVYDNLVKEELTAYLQAQNQAFDVILSADTLNYFGALEAVLTGARRALRDGGYFFFTVESSNSATIDADVGYHLYPHGRYSHSESYLRNTLENAGFAIIAMETAVLRYENYLPVMAFAVTCYAVRVS